jgi:hypothetical protein
MAESQAAPVFTFDFRVLTCSCPSGMRGMTVPQATPETPKRIEPTARVGFGHGQDGRATSTRVTHCPASAIGRIEVRGEEEQVSGSTASPLMLAAHTAPHRISTGSGGKMKQIDESGVRIPKSEVRSARQ